MLIYDMLPQSFCRAILLQLSPNFLCLQISLSKSSRLHTNRLKNVSIRLSGVFLESGKQTPQIFIRC